MRVTNRSSVAQLFAAVALGLAMLTSAAGSSAAAPAPSINSFSPTSGTATSSSDFTVTSGGTHPRDISLRLRLHLVAKGKVTATDGFDGCMLDVVQRRVGDHWRRVGQVVTSSNTGRYRVRIPNRSGWYRARAIKLTFTTGGGCAEATSEIVRYQR